jgi:hypothetical protein
MVVSESVSQDLSPETDVTSWIILHLLVHSVW